MISSKALRDWIIKRGFMRPADVVIPRYDGSDYLQRWHLIPRNRFLNIYLHRFVSSDDARALHDHPWLSVSWLLHGSYIDHTMDDSGIHYRVRAHEGDVFFRLSAKKPHRIEIDGSPVWTLFITGPRFRQWGFHCPLKGWVHWKEFTKAVSGYPYGKGCE